MLQALRYRALNGLTLSALRHDANAFARVLHDPEKIQKTILFDLLGRNAATAYGQRHGFSSIRSVREYQERVPAVSYDDLAPWIERIKSGETGVLSREPTLMFEKSSGSASAAKYIPYTRSLRAQFHAALAPWITDLYRSFPGLDRGCAYWLVTPLSRQREVTPGGIPVGFDSDCDYFGSVSRWVLRQTMAVRADLARVHDLERCLCLTLRFLLRAPYLTLISVWNPSFLLLLLDHLERYGDRLARDLLSGCAATQEPGWSDFPLPPHRRQGEKLLSTLRRGQADPAVLWPNLRLISCWTSAQSAALVPDVQQRFPQAAIQGKGLLATEGIVSIPIERYGGCAAAVRSHFLEFFDQASGNYRQISELEEGREYSVLLTTGGGLWRYQLGDRVRMKGFAKQTPLLEFVGKDDCVCDLRGEKLNAVFVSRSLSEFESCRHARFAMLAPSGEGTPAYVLFLESSTCEPDLATRLDHKLQENPHYAYCRRIGQLGSLRVFRVQTGAAATYMQQCEALGQRAGSVKPTPLHKWSGWEHVFRAHCVDVRSPEAACA